MALSLAADKETGPVKKTKWYRQLYFWVIVAIILGVLVGWLWPGFGTAMEPVGMTWRPFVGGVNSSWTEKSSCGRSTPICTIS